MYSIITVKNRLEKQLLELVNQHFSTSLDSINVSFPTHSQNGDLTSNIALQLAKALKSNPQEIANQIIAKIELPQEIAKAEIAGPGFINFFLANSYLTSYIQHFKGHDFHPLNQPSPTIIEYSQPNIAKPLGVHHIITTVLGQTLVNIGRFLGHNILAYNYLGDYGTQFGKLLVAIEKYNQKKISDLNIHDLLDLYVLYHKKSELEPELDDLARNKSFALENRDPAVQKIWELIIKISEQDMQETYDMLGGIKFDVVDSESQRIPMLTGLLEEGKTQDIFEVGDKGAFVVNFPEADNLPPLLVQRSDGATVYATRDIATVKHRQTQVTPKEIIYVVDSAQSLHFRQFFAASKRFSWFNPDSKLTHLSFGRMSFKHMAMSTRKGQIITLKDIINEATEKVLEIIKEKNPNLNNAQDVAQKVGVGALKYAILSTSPGKDIVFDKDSVLSFEGNTGPYLQYTYARTKSILRKSSELTHDTTSFEAEFNETEKELIKKINSFKYSVQQSWNQRKPNILCLAIYELSQVYNRFYANNPVLTAPTQNLINQRLFLTQAAANTLQTGLELLGIYPVEEM